MIFLNGMCCGAWIIIVVNQIALNKSSKWIRLETEKYKTFVNSILEQNKINHDINDNNVIDITDVEKSKAKELI
jgi:hypothetical protein